MQEINIEGIIEELKKTDEWGKYETKLKSNLNIFGIDFSLEKLIGIEGVKEKDGNILYLKENAKKEKDIKKNDIWKWSERDKNFKEFKILELKFLDLFLEKIKFCPYCGKIPLIRYKNDKKEKKGTFHLDHIFPKSDYRYLTYNFYNIIPVCSICNQLKGKKNLYNVKDKVFHPYYGWIKKEGEKTKILMGDFNVKCNFFSKHSKFFSLDKIFHNSQDTKNDIWFIRDKIEKIKTEKINIEKLKLNKNLKEGDKIKKLEGEKLKKFLNDRKNLFFKNYYPQKKQNILKFSNGKLKKNLIENLEI